MIAKVILDRSQMHLFGWYIQINMSAHYMRGERLRITLHKLLWQELCLCPDSTAFYPKWVLNKTFFKQIGISRIISVAS
ncbi:hypothetical protein U9M48_030988 [Paspalum notatum var. saurae]|uniref:Uncharacterized protein n=1 Tax=Paspalum notatum var. saurae TaxID=547442 RepID=A0AAQ3X382_PASNO